jgi:GNAT superfamily N-acetyltransferase
MEIKYRHDILPQTDLVIEVFNSSGINRPTSDIDRIKKMFENSNLVVTAWDKEILVGISRALTDFCYSCYLSDLAVKKEYQKKGIGKELIKYTKNAVGDNCNLLLLSAQFYFLLNRPLIITLK